MQNDLAMSGESSSIAMGNAADEVEKMATHVRCVNADEGFAGAISLILNDDSRSLEPISRLRYPRMSALQNEPVPSGTGCGRLRAG